MSDRSKLSGVSRPTVAPAVPVALALAAQAFGQGQFDELRKRYLPRDGGPAHAVLSADLDGDGDRDLVQAWGVDTSWAGAPAARRLYLNDGDGGYRDESAVRMPSNMRAAAADVVCCDGDGDGDEDLVFANDYQNRLYLNDGSGVFADRPLPTMIDFTHAVAGADVDGDGDIDLLFGHDGVDRLCLNDGSGTFTDAPPRLPGEALSTPWCPKSRTTRLGALGLAATAGLESAGSSTGRTAQTATAFPRLPRRPSPQAARS